MESSSWSALLQRLPLDQHEKLMMVTSGGTEMAIQRILFIQGDCLIIKGRLSGSQDTGRVFFIPYSHIDYLGFQTAVLESDIRNWFGEDELLARLEKSEAPATDAAAAAEGTNGEAAPAASEAAPTAPEATPAEGPAGSGPAPSKPSSGVRPALSPSRSALLDRVKSRSSGIIGNRNGEN
jgi:hypothetical protein